MPASTDEAIKTYRYLRIGMIGAVVLLAASIAYEQNKVGCWQTSISAYYYTPVRAIFVGSMVAVGLSLIVYKGRDPYEDICLNWAGMLAPVVAIAPTTDVGRCWSVPPRPLPLNEDGSLADWVVVNLENNFYALLIAGGVGLIVAAVIAMVVTGSVREPFTNGQHRGTRVTLGATALMLLFAWVLSLTWNDFNTRAHGGAAVLMFIFLIGAVIAAAHQRWKENCGHSIWSGLYTAVAVLMVLGGILFPTTRIADEHTVFALEAYEIVLFAVYWGIQTREKWHEKFVEDIR